jgi:hypothetical protein
MRIGKGKVDGEVVLISTLPDILDQLAAVHDSFWGGHVPGCQNSNRSRLLINMILTRVDFSQPSGRMLKISKKTYSAMRRRLASPK